MTWTRLSDTFADSPKVLKLSDAAFRCHVIALVWCNKHLTNGAIPARAVAMFAPGPEVVEELVAAELWTAEADGYQLDWTDQMTKEALEDRAEKSAARVREWRANRDDRRRRHDLDDHSRCLPADCRAAAGNAVSNDVTNEASNGVRTGAPNPNPSPNPNPTPREGEGKGEGSAAEAAAPSARATGSASSSELEVANVMQRIREAGKL